MASKIPPAAEPASPVLVLPAAGTIRLTWDKLAMFRADECGAFATRGTGFARAAKYLWAMLPPPVQAYYPTPESVAAVLPPVREVNAAIDAAIKAAGEGMSPKNVFGSTSGPSPSSS